MKVRYLSALILATTLTGGCSSLGGQDGGWFQSSPQNASDRGELSEAELLDSQRLNVAAGDDSLKDAVETGRGDNAAATAKLDDSIDPSLRGTARQARQKLDDPEAGNPDSAGDQNADLWSRIRSGFALDHSVSNERVQAQLEWYRSHPSYIERVVDRGSRYLHYIVTETEKRGLPTELALLPVVESAFDPFAYSHGRAAGLWQFIPSTGKYFGLTQSWWHDERRDVVAATDAALTYLERLAKRFDGDYTLALAAYNSGGGTVSSAIRRNTQRGKATDFWALDLPRETRHYVPKLIALAKIFDDPAAHGIQLPPLEDKPYFEIVDTGSQIDLAQAATLAGVDVDEIYLLNPSFNRWATTPEGPHRLLVPAENAERFRTSLAALDPATRVSWESYRIVSGDSLIGIARKFGTTPDVLREVNKLNGNLIRAGQQLVIPKASKGSSAYVLSASQRLARQQARGGRNSNGTRVDYRVQRGDTFWDIAREHGVSVRQVAAWNGMAPGDPLIPGKKLVIWSKTNTSAAASGGRGDAMVRRVGYKVRKGDSLARIASRFAVNVRDIASWNDLNTARYLQPGQSLVLYVDVRNSP